jgi:hypothetical protein
MIDTAPDVERRYRELLLRRPGEARFRMGCSMHALARTLVRASLLAHDPQASAAAIRRGLFLRFYGGDFDAGTRESILARLDNDPERGRSAVSPITGSPPRSGPSRGTAGVERAMPRRIPVDWDELGAALTTNAAERSCYLDPRTGEVLMVPVDRLDGEDDWPSDDDIDAGLDAGDLLAIEPLGAPVEYGWMAEFASSVGDARLRELLELALSGRGAFRRFKNVLLDFPAERGRWFAVRDAHLRAAAREWLAEQGIEAIAAPPAVQ